MSLRVFGVAAVFVVISVIATAFVLDDIVTIGPLVVLMLLAFIAAQRDALFADETAVSGSMIVVCACIIGLGGSELAAPVLCAASASVLKEQVRDRQFLKLSVNALGTVLPAFLATVMFRAAGGSLAWQVLGSIGAVAIYWLANNAVVGLALGLAYGRPLRAISELVRSDMVMLLFGLGGAICGVVMTEVGIWTGIAALVALLVALDVFVISVPAGLGALRSRWTVVLARGISGGVAGTVAALVTRAASIGAFGAIAGLAAGIAAGAVVILLVVGARLLITRRPVDAAVLGGLVLVELVFPVVAAVSGVVTALGGLSAGLIIASALVVCGSIVVAVRRGRAASAPPDIDDDTIMAAVVEAMLDGLPSPTRDR